MYHTNHYTLEKYRIFAVFSRTSDDIWLKSRHQTEQTTIYDNADS